MPHYVPEPGETGIVVETSFYKWTPLPYSFRASKPRIVVDGQEVPGTQWGTNFVPVEPGLHHVRISTVPNIWAQFHLVPSAPLGEMGFADAMIPVQQRYQTQTYYQASLTKIFGGALGPEPRDIFPAQRAIQVINAVVGVGMLVLSAAIVNQVLLR